MGARGGCTTAKELSLYYCDLLEAFAYHVQEGEELKCSPFKQIPTIFAGHTSD